MGGVRRPTVAIVAASMLGSAGNALADFKTGNGLLQMCRGPTAVEISGCTEYIVAVVDLMAHFPVNGLSACPAPTVTGSQVRDVAIQYLKSHREEDQNSAATLVAEAIGRAFPCQ